MPLWLDLLRTPMAAPETKGLKRMRMTILSICTVLLVSIATLAPLRAAIGIAAGGLVAVLLAVLAILVPVYVVTKNRADDRYLDTLGEEREP